MKNRRIIAFTGLWIGLLFLPAGCSSSQPDKKQAMETQWKQSSSVAQLPAIENLITAGRISEAKKEINKSLQTLSDSAQVHYLAGRIHVIDEHYDKAKWSFLKAIELDPQMASAWHALGSLAVLDKDNGHALDCYVQAFRLEPLKTEHVLSLSETYIETGQMEQARKVLKDGLVKQPRNLELMLALAGLDRQSGQPDDAATLYEQAILIHGAKPEILEPCAYFYASRRQWQKAADLFEQLISQYPTGSEHYTPALRSLAMCLFNAGRYAESLKKFDALSVLCRNDANVWLYMAQAALGADDAARAAACAQKSLQMKPGQSDAYAILGSAQYLQGYYHEAILSFDRVTDDAELGAYAWFMTGRCCQRLGQTIQANAAFSRAEELNPHGRLVRTFLKRTMQPL
jgi:tetratricopeptide (TPR) repeat protein